LHLPEYRGLQHPDDTIPTWNLHALLSQLRAGNVTTSAGSSGR